MDSHGGASLFSIEKNRAIEIIEEVKSAVKNWRAIAKRYGLSSAQQELKSRAFQQAEI